MLQNEKGGEPTMSADFVTHLIGLLPNQSKDMVMERLGISANT